ncbi:hypothetical protein DIPPA_08107 [Diplonema papillatum]|nr:hypothetical protein DIPPA_08107 [Diplonema papillatum]
MELEDEIEQNLREEESLLARAVEASDEAKEMLASAERIQICLTSSKRLHDKALQSRWDELVAKGVINELTHENKILETKTEEQRAQIRKLLEVTAPIKSDLTYELQGVLGKETNVVILDERTSRGATIVSDDPRPFLLQQKEVQAKTIETLLVQLNAERAFFETQTASTSGAHAVHGSGVKDFSGMLAGIIDEQAELCRRLAVEKNTALRVTEPNLSAAEARLRGLSCELEGLRDTLRSEEANRQADLEAVSLRLNASCVRTVHNTRESAVDQERALVAQKAAFAAEKQARVDCLRATKQRIRALAAKQQKLREARGQLAGPKTDIGHIKASLFDAEQELLAEGGHELSAGRRAKYLNRLHALYMRYLPPPKPDPWKH